MSDPVEVAIVAAMPREIWPLVSRWRTEKIATSDGRMYPVFRNQNTVALCSGPTSASAALATSMLVERLQPRMLLSVGFAGSLQSDVRVGDVVIPEQVVNASTGRNYSTESGHGTLVTVDHVVGREEKSHLARQWNAQAVDMEACAVAEVAQRDGVEFAAVKVISDDASAEMEFVSKFVTPDGFRTGAFLRHVAVRPALWSSVRKLQVNSEQATKVLCGALESLLHDPEGITCALSNLAKGPMETGARCQ